MCLWDEALERTLPGSGPSVAGSTSLPTVTSAELDVQGRRAAHRSAQGSLKTVPSVM